MTDDSPVDVLPDAEESVGQFVDGYVRAWNSHDADRLLASVHREFVCDDTLWPTIKREHADLWGRLIAQGTAFSGVRFDPVDCPYRLDATKVAPR